MPGDGSGAHVLEAVAVPAWLDEVHALFESLWDDAPDVVPADRMAFETAVSEVAANIVRHAGRGEAVSVRLMLRAGDDDVEARLEDGGYPFDENDAEAPAGSGTTGAEDLAEGGRGLVLARALTDSLVYERHGRVNRWYLTRRRTGP